MQSGTCLCWGSTYYIAVYHRFITWFCSVACGFGSAQVGWRAAISRGLRGRQIANIGRANIVNDGVSTSRRMRSMNPTCHDKTEGRLADCGRLQKPVSCLQ